jgi:hypothetical protein
MTHRWLLCFIALAWTAGAIADDANAVAAASPTRLRVVVVAVTDFKGDYVSPRLTLSFKNAIENIRGFFASNFPADSTEFHLVTGAEQTTADSLSHYFREEFPRIADRAITVLFIISHGEQQERPGDFAFPNDLLIVASDTEADRLPSRTLSFNRDIVPALQYLHPGSVVLAFIDTCHSGSAANLGLTIGSQLRDEAGLKMMVLASALRSASAYQATFSTALVGFWADQKKGNAEGCILPYEAPQALRDRIAGLIQSKLEPGEGLPQLVVDYKGNFCLESFAKHGGLLMLFNPGERDEVVQVIAANAGADAKRAKQYRVGRHNIEPLKLDRAQYVVISKFENGQERRSKVSLDDYPIGLLNIGNTPPDPEVLGKAYLEASRLSEFAEESAKYKQYYLKAAYAALAQSTDAHAKDAQTKQVYERLAQNGGLDFNWERFALSGKNPSPKVLAQSTTAMVDDQVYAGKPTQLADTAVLAGYFSAAGKLYEAVAAKDRSKRSFLLLKQASLAYQAAGEIEQAKKAEQGAFNAARRFKISPAETGSPATLSCDFCSQVEQIEFTKSVKSAALPKVLRAVQPTVELDGSKPASTDVAWANFPTEATNWH